MSVPDHRLLEHRDFDYYLIVDFEATCEALRNRSHAAEIIEWPTVVVKVQSNYFSKNLKSLNDDCKQKF